jgi:hypothetical protein
MVNHDLLKLNCGETMAISRQKFRRKFMVNGILCDEAYAMLTGESRRDGGSRATRPGPTNWAVIP